jgi:hypothetical protein
MNLRKLEDMKDFYKSAQVVQAPRCTGGITDSTQAPVPHYVESCTSARIDSASFIVARLAL